MLSPDYSGEPPHQRLRNREGLVTLHRLRRARDKPETRRVGRAGFGQGFDQEERAAPSAVRLAIRTLRRMPRRVEAPQVHNSAARPRARFQYRLQQPRIILQASRIHAVTSGLDLGVSLAR